MSTKEESKGSSEAETKTMSQKISERASSFASEAQKDMGLAAKGVGKMISNTQQFLDKKGRKFSKFLDEKGDEGEKWWMKNKGVGSALKDTASYFKKGASTLSRFGKGAYDEGKKILEDRENTKILNDAIGESYASKGIAKDNGKIIVKNFDETEGQYKGYKLVKTDEVYAKYEMYFRDKSTVDQTNPSKSITMLIPTPYAMEMGYNRKERNKEEFIKSVLTDILGREPSRGDIKKHNDGNKYVDHSKMDNVEKFKMDQNNMKDFIQKYNAQVDIHIKKTLENEHNHNMKTMPEKNIGLSDPNQSPTGMLDPAALRASEAADAAAATALQKAESNLPFAPPVSQVPVAQSPLPPAKGGGRKRKGGNMFSNAFKGVHMPDMMSQKAPEAPVSREQELKMKYYMDLSEFVLPNLMEQPNAVEDLISGKEKVMATDSSSDVKDQGGVKGMFGRMFKGGRKTRKIKKNKVKKTKKVKKIKKTRKSKRKKVRKTNRRR